MNALKNDSGTAELAELDKQAQLLAARFETKPASVHYFARYGNLMFFLPGSYPRVRFRHVVNKQFLRLRECAENAFHGKNRSIPFPVVTMVTHKGTWKQFCNIF